MTDAYPPFRLDMGGHEAGARHRRGRRREAEAGAWALVSSRMSRRAAARQARAVQTLATQGA